MAVEQVWQAISAVQGELGGVEKRRVQNFTAFAVDDVYAAVKPLLVKHGLVLVPQVERVEYAAGSFKGGTEYVDARVVVAYDLVAVEDGSKATMRFAAEGRDSQDKATNKAMQQALKYALVQLLMIGTGENAEEDPEPKAKRNPNRELHRVKNHLLGLLDGDRTEAVEAWPLLLEKAAVEEASWTKTQADEVISVADRMFGG